MTSPVDIRPDHLEIVQGILREHLSAGSKVWVFGNRANWTTNESSDLDLALEGDGEISLKVLGGLKDASRTRLFPTRLTLLTSTGLGTLSGKPQIHRECLYPWMGKV